MTQIKNDRIASTPLILQNIDTLERVAGLDGDKIIEAHGSVHLSHCMECKKEYSQDWMKGKILNKQ